MVGVTGADSDLVGCNQQEGEELPKCFLGGGEG